MANQPRQSWRICPILLGRPARWQFLYRRRALAQLRHSCARSCSVQFQSRGITAVVLSRQDIRQLSQLHVSILVAHAPYCTKGKIALMCGVNMNASHNTPCWALQVCLQCKSRCSSVGRALPLSKVEETAASLPKC